MNKSWPWLANLYISPSVHSSPLQFQPQSHRLLNRIVRLDMTIVHSKSTSLAKRQDPQVIPVTESYLTLSQCDLFNIVKVRLAQLGEAKIASSVKISILPLSPNVNTTVSIWSPNTMWNSQCWSPNTKVPIPKSQYWSLNTKSKYKSWNLNVKSPGSFSIFVAILAIYFLTKCQKVITVLSSNGLRAAYLFCTQGCWPPNGE